MSILINGSKIEFFFPGRDIRQGDPMSPHIFILYLEMLSKNICHEVDLGYWNPIKISRTGPQLSHLFFADDLTLMVRADNKNCDSILRTMNSFCALSGQKINLDKSKVLFYANCDPTIRKILSHALQVKQSSTFGRYLGFPFSTKNQSQETSNSSLIT